jgi:serine/threonine-protein kinase
LALSPDGTRLAFLGWDGERTMLYARPLSEFDREPLAGTEGAYGPFFSPDGEWVAFFAGEELKKVPFDGSSSPLSLGPVSLPYYGLWGPDDWIYFRNNEGVQLARISAAGGDIRVLRSRLYAVTDFLPGNRVMGTTFVGDRTEIGTEPMDAAGFTGLGIRGTWPVLIEGNELAFARGGHLFTVAVDPETTQPTGQPRQIVGGIWSDADRQQVSVSRSGIVAYVPGPRENRTRFVFVDRAGNREVLPFDPQEYGMFQLSPDGSKIVVHRPTSVVEEDLWVFDVDRSTVEQISRVGSNFYPAWTVAADAVLGQSCRSGECVAKLFPVGRSGSPTVIVDANVSPSDATTIEGREVVVAGSQAGLIAVFLDGSDRIDTLVTQPASIWGPSVSPDGRFMAYTSNITQQYEVWVEPFPDTGRRWQASLGGGEEPKWSVDGKELIYRLGQRLYAVDVTVAGDEPRFGEPRVVYEGPFYNVFGLSYDVAPDGRFLVLEPAEETGDLREIRVMKGW